MEPLGDDVDEFQRMVRRHVGRPAGADALRSIHKQQRQHGNVETRLHHQAVVFQMLPIYITRE